MKIADTSMAGAVGPAFDAASAAPAERNAKSGRVGTVPRVFVVQIGTTVLGTLTRQIR